MHWVGYFSVMPSLCSPYMRLVVIRICLLITPTGPFLSFLRFERDSLVGCSIRLPNDGWYQGALAKP